MSSDFMFTSGSVTEGHPDKLCDQIADAVVDRFLLLDPLARVVAECAAAKGILFIACHFASSAVVDIPEIARQLIGQVGYQDALFNPKDCTVMTSLSELPAVVRPEADERMLDDEAIDRIGATHIANAFGFACKQSAAMLPLPLWLAHKLARRLAAVRLKRQLRYLAPDGKTQVCVEFRDRRPHRIHSITLLASQLAEAAVSARQLHDDLYEQVVRPAFLDEAIQPDDKTRLFINPDGPNIGGGPAAHAGLTGRKNAIDTYGEYSRHSEAALSGKDPGRIDRVGAYAARYAAKNLVAAGLAEECEVQLGYAIGQAQPVSVRVQTFGSGARPDEELTALVRDRFDLRPAGIVRQFNLRQLPALYSGRFYRRLAVYGHMGRMDMGLPWELTDKAAELV
jgi:S-adenosylmethionine synthetase